MMGNIFIQLLDEQDRPIAHYNFPAKHFTNSDPGPHWCILSAEKSVGEIMNDYDAGAVSIKLFINDVKKNGEVNPAQYPPWKKRAAKRLGSRLIRAFIFQCRGLPTGQGDDVSDPYIRCWNQQGKDIRTSHINDSINPMFYEAREYDFEFG